MKKSGAIKKGLGAIMKDTKTIENETNITDLMTDKNRLLSERQTAKILNVSFETLRQSIRSKGKIQYYKINSKVMFRVNDILDYLDRCKVEPKN
jgi:hypothetical protein